MSKESFTPTGTDASLNGQNNWERYVSPEATTLLAQFRSTTDVAQQKAIAYKLEAIQLRDLPYIPVMTRPTGTTYSTLHFTGWPTEQNFYVEGTPNSYPDRVVVMTASTLSKRATCHGPGAEPLRLRARPKRLQPQRRSPAIRLQPEVPHAVVATAALPSGLSRRSHPHTSVRAPSPTGKGACRCTSPGAWAST